MKTGKKIMSMFLICVLVFATLALVGCGGNNDEKEAAGETGEFTLVEPGKLMVGSDCDYPPFIQLDADGNPEGFEYDMMLALAEELGLELVYISPQAFDTLIPQVAAGGKMDVAVSSFTITPERAEEIDFTDPYFVDGVNQAVTVPTNSEITSVEQFNGKKVGVQAGTTGGQWAEENLTGTEVVPFTTITDAFNAMMAGKVDGCVNDLPAAEGLIEKSFSDVKVLKSVPTAEEYGIVVSQDNPELTKALNVGLKKLVDDGTLEQLAAKWNL